MPSTVFLGCKIRGYDDFQRICGILEGLDVFGVAMVRVRGGIGLSDVAIPRVIGETGVIDFAILRVVTTIENSGIVDTGDMCFAVVPSLRSG